MMNPEQIKQEQERVNKLLEGITPGEWEVVDETTVWIGEDDFFWVHAEKDAALIAAAPDIARAYAALLAAHAEALEREQEALNVLEGLLDEAWDGQRAYVPDSSTCAAAYEAFKRLAAARVGCTPTPPPAQAPAGGEG